MVGVSSEGGGLLKSLGLCDGRPLKCFPAEGPGTRPPLPCGPCEPHLVTPGTRTHILHAQTAPLRRPAPPVCSSRYCSVRRGNTWHTCASYEPNDTFYSCQPPLLQSWPLLSYGAGTLHPPPPAPPARRDRRGRLSDNRELMARSSADGPAWKSIIAALPPSLPLPSSLARPMSTTFTEVFANLELCVAGGGPGHCDRCRERERARSERERDINYCC